LKSRPLNRNLETLRKTRDLLTKAEVPSAAAEAEILVRHFAKLTRIELFAGPKTVSPRDAARIAAAARLRVKGKALQLILGEAPFDGHSFFVTKNVLIPRPETEGLVEEAERLVSALPAGVKSPQILDLGTGSGCIAVSLTLRKPACRMTALDVSAAALNVARKNARNKGLRDNIRFLKSDLFSALKNERFDLIVSNPPYIPSGEIWGLQPEVRSEPRLALSGGKDGLRTIEKILKDAPRFLRDGGTLLMEIGKGQSKTLAKKYSDSAAWLAPRFVKDLADVERVAVFEKKS
jgi:release factor glutamine methyltransferase